MLKKAKFIWETMIRLLFENKWPHKTKETFVHFSEPSFLRLSSLWLEFSRIWKSTRKHGNLIFSQSLEDKLKAWWNFTENWWNNPHFQLISLICSLKKFHHFWIHFGGFWQMAFPWNSKFEFYSRINLKKRGGIAKTRKQNFTQTHLVYFPFPKLVFIKNGS